MSATLQNGGNPFQGSDGSNSASTCTVSNVVVASGTGTKMLICVQGEGNGLAGDREVSSISVNGNSGLATRLGRTNGPQWSWAEIWGVESPPVGTYNVVVTLNGLDASHVSVYVADGCDSSGFTTEQHAASTGTGAGVSLLDTVVGDIIIDSLCIDATGHSPIAAGGGTNANGTLSSFCTFGTQAYNAVGSGDAPSWSWTGSADYSYVAVAFQALVVPPQQVRPDADVTTTGWSTAPLWDKVDESSADGTVIVGTFS